MIDITRKESCCGCGACEQICPQNCISLIADYEGFLYPSVNKKECTNCHLCEKVCPVLNQDSERFPLKVLAAYNMNDNVRSESSSGGIFSIVAEEVIKQNGIVFGVKFDKNWNVAFDHTDNINGIKPYRGSKYVQARIDNNYKLVKKYLEIGKLVLFTGTPCQIAGLRTFLRKDYDNLILMDLICEGVPSPKIWKRYLYEEIERQCNIRYKIPFKQVEIKSISFRNKDNGWDNFGFSFTLSKKSDNSGKEEILPTYTSRKSAYLQAMFHYLDLRPICYECPFKSCKSHSDITIADYWGIHILHPEIYDNKGTSMVYLHTSKGQHFLPTNKIKYIETTYREAWGANNIITSVNKHPRRDIFFSRIDETSSIIKLLERNTISLKKRIAKELLSICLPPKIYQFIQEWIWKQRRKSRW